MSDLEKIAEDVVADALPNDGKLDIEALRESIVEYVDSAAESVCTYYHHCEDIISRYESDRFADCDSADDMGREYKPSEYREAMAAYAYWIARSVIDGNAHHIVDSLAEAIAELESELDTLGVEYDSDAFRISADCIHGWASHDRENGNGGCFWISRQLDGCNAVAIPVSGMWITYTWTP